MIVDKVQSAYLNSTAFQSILQQIEKADIDLAFQNNVSIAFLVSSLLKKVDKKLIVLLESERQVKQFVEDLNEICKVDVVYFPSIGSAVWSELGPQSVDVGHRLFAVKSLLQNNVKVVVTTPFALLEKIPEKTKVQQYSLTISAGEELPFSDFVAFCVNNGFVRQERVDRPGEMSVRGGIVDLFMFEESNPVRIEFWGDEVESIRVFDIESQRSLEKLNSIDIFPASSAGAYCSLDERNVYDLEYQESLLHYFEQNTLLIVQNSSLLENRLDDFLNNARHKYDAHFEKEEYPEFAFSDFFVADRVLLEKMKSFKKIQIGCLQPQVDFGIQSNIHFGGKLELFQKQLASNALLLQKHHIGNVLLCDTDDQKKRIVDLFDKENFDHGLLVEQLNLSEGFTWPDEGFYIYTTRELYSKVRMPKLDKIQRRVASIKENLSIDPGDFVVHNDYGVAAFRGLDKIKAYGKERECLVLEYEGGDKLYVPLEKMDQVQKYSSREGVVPVLNKLGTQTWDKLKSRTKKRMKEIAAQLIKLYATRKMRPGYAFSPDTVWQQELEAAFQYEETIDQLAAINDVKNDMQSAQPMDRLICGDVGYGKTEVAVRAAFKAVNDGKQVGVLVPTTILAQQHFDTFSGRISAFPAKIELLNRFKSPKEQKETLRRLKSGEVDIVVGTHRLLSADVEFKDIGLLIVDEEQRFGVTHKEKIKLIKSSVDTLSLSATPIPRTMHMAMMGAKDMSIINTPPHNRLSVKTEAIHFDPDIIREAILREVDRGGQVFFVHNRVQSIYAMADTVREIVPEVDIAVAHGQMKGHELEKVMVKFLRGDVKVLVSTMIIESGIDMPHANTLIVNRADRFGLAQLYQLRGRVGRSDQQAYAYLIIPPMKKMSTDSIRRLQTIQEYSQLGAGYKIAMRDLEIRGAGNIFGAEQTGFVNALGYELYMKIIQEAIKEIRQEMNLDEQQELEQEVIVDSKIEIAVDAYLPDDFIETPSERVHMYKRLVEAKSLDIIQDLYKEVVDRFGALPIEAENLFNYITIKVLASRARISRLSVQKGILHGQFDLLYVPQGNDFRPWLAGIVQHAPDHFEIKQKPKFLEFEMDLDARPGKILEATKKFLEKII